MESEEDRKWSALASIWTAPDEAIDIAQVQRQIRRRARNSDLLFALDAAQGLGALGLGIYFLNLWTWPHSLVGITLLLFGGVALGLAYWTRFAAGGAAIADAREAFRVSVRQARAGIRWAISGYCVAATGVILLIVLGYAHSQPLYRSVFQLPYWVKTAGVSAYLVFLLWRCTRLLIENRRYLAGLNAIERDLFPADGDQPDGAGRG